MSVTLVRHTSLAVASGICYGQSDIEVAESFASEAESISEKLRHCDRLITSPLSRCIKLADVIGQRFGLKPMVDARVAEMNFGEWEQQPWSAIPRHQLDAWAGDFLHARPHGGESVAMFRRRVRAAVREHEHQNRDTVIVCHSGVIRVQLSTGDRLEDFDASPGFGAIVVLPQEEGEVDERRT